MLRLPPSIAWFIGLCLLFVLAATSLRAPADEAVAPDGGADAADLAEPPLWPVGFKLPREMTQGWRNAESRQAKAEAHVLVWTPPGVEHIRAVILIPENSDSIHVFEHPAIRDVAAKQKIGIVYLRHFDGSVVERVNPPDEPGLVYQAVLDRVAEATGVEEYRHAPWITFGKSSRGMFPYRTEWMFPDRVIATIAYHAETPTWPLPEWARYEDQTNLHLSINGQEEWDGTWYRHVRPMLLNYHAHTRWLPHQVVVHGVGHGNYVDAHGKPGWGQPVPDGTMSVQRVWDYIALFIDKAMDLRVPKEGYPTKQPTDLLTVSPKGGYLIHPRAPEELLGMRWMAFRKGDNKYEVIPWPEEKSPVFDTTDGDVDKSLLIRRYEDVPEAERADYLWVPDREMAEAWMKLHDVEGSSRGVLPGDGR